MRNFFAIRLVLLATCFFIFLIQAKAQFNYDEEKVPPYTLPDVLETVNGQRVANKTLWEKARRPEILGLFENEVYGKTPKGYDSIRFITTNENAAAMEGKAHLKEIKILVYNKHKSVDINLVLFTPNDVKGAAPAFLLINNRSSRNTAPARDTLSGFWPAEMVIDK